MLWWIATDVSSLNTGGRKKNPLGFVQTPAVNTPLICIQTAEIEEVFFCYHVATKYASGKVCQNLSQRFP